MAVPVSESIAFSVGITMPVAYTIGRFQPPTIGHKSLIEKVIETAAGGGAFVFVSSTMSPAAKNPLTSAMKIPILQHMFAGRPVTFVDTATCDPPCGGPLNAFNWLVKQEKKDITLVMGQDRAADFGAGAAMWKEGKPDAFVPFGAQVRKPDLDDLSEENMSGTKSRELAKRGMKPEFYTSVGYDYADGENKDVEAIYGKIRGFLPAKKAAPKSPTSPKPKPAAAAAPPEEPKAKRARRGGDPTDETMTSADAEFDYPQPQGGRRRTYRRCRKCGLPKKPETQ
jgi:hypothetical protein